MQATFDDFAGFGNHLREWWNEPVDYAAQVQYFTKRAKSGPIQVLIGIGTGTNGLLSLFVLFPSARTPASQIVVAMFAVLQLFFGVGIGVIGHGRLGGYRSLSSFPQTSG